MSFIVRLHLQIFLHFIYANIYIYIYILTVHFYHLPLDNDRSTVETSTFTVDFYR